MSNYSYPILPMLLCLLAVTAGRAQGWEHYYGGMNEDFGSAVLQTNDDGLLVVGFSESFGDDNDEDIYLIRTDVDGDLIWSTIVDEDFIERGYHIVPAHDGGYLIAGDHNDGPLEDFDGYLLKIDEDGQLLWSRSFGAEGDDRFYHILPTDDGYLLTGQTTQDGLNRAWLVWTDTLGNTLQETTSTYWHDDALRASAPFNGGYASVGTTMNPANNSEDILLLFTDTEGTEVGRQFLGTNEYDFGSTLKALPDGGLIVAGRATDNINGYAGRLSASGSVFWQQTIGTPLGEEFFDVVATPDGGYTLVGIQEVTTSDIDMWLVHLNGSGDVEWQRNIGRNENFDDGRGIALLRNGGYALAGTNSLSSAFFNDVSIVTTNANGDVLTNALRGRVFYDQNNDCGFQNGEILLPEWLIVAEGAQTYYGSTDENGYYEIPVDTGTYNLRILPQNAYWEPCVAVYNNLNTAALYDTLTLDFPMTAAVNCPLLEVDLSTQWVTACDEGLNYFVHYANRGTGAATDSYVELTLDPNLSYNTASLPLISQSGQVFRFDPGTIGIGETGSFSINVDVSCDLQAYEAVVNSAEIFPNENCLPVDPDWDGSSIEVTGDCDGDQVNFNIINTGLPMTQSVDFVIIEDVLVLRTGTIELDMGETLTETITGDGSTYRIIIDQSNGHPGRSFPTMAVEGCATDGDYSTGLYTQFPENDGLPALSVDAQENQPAQEAAFRLRGYPKGYERNDTSYLAAGRNIEYHLAWTNPTPDTLRRIVIRDTLPAPLDPATLRGGASSHPYEVVHYGQGVVRFILDEASLAPGATAFLRFEIGQRPGLETGTQIRNRATLYAGYQMPLTTNELIYTIGGTPENFVLVDVREADPNRIAVTVAPNPFSEQTVLQLPGGTSGQHRLSVMGSDGTILLIRDFSGAEVGLWSADLPKGLLFWQIDDENGGTIASGRVVRH